MRSLLDAAIAVLLVVEIARCRREVKQLLRQRRWLRVAFGVGLTVMSIGIHGEAMLHDRLLSQHQIAAA